MKAMGLAAGAAVLGGDLANVLYGQEPAERVKVVRTTREESIVAGEAQPQVVAQMVDDAVVALTGKRNAHAAWSSLFRASDVVGIKINCLGAPGIYTRREVVEAIVSGLQSAGVKPDQIIIWDRPESHLRRLGNIYATQTGPGVKCYASDTPGVGGYSEEVETYGGVKTRLARLLKDKITALVNVPVLKYHAMAGGATVSLKNHLGLVQNPADFHPNKCIAVADLNTAPTIVSKTRLIVCDALWATFKGSASFSGPDTLFQPRAVLASLNPVALDTIGCEMIDAERARHGLAPVRNNVVHLDRAAQLGLGPKSRAGIDLVAI